MSTIGRYTALAKVADGGMAEIFLAVQRGGQGFERKVILKRVRAQVAQDAELLKALHDEARIAMGLAHSNIAQVLDVGEAQGRTFLVLELVDGWSLSQLMRRAAQAQQPLPLGLSLFVCAQLCRALAHAHGFSRDGRPLNIVHRDLSPQNVLISSEGEVKLTDFGIAWAEIREVQTKIGLVKGKPAYMSPEQARAEPLDGRSDLFSLGVMLYELATGARPFRGANDYEVLLKVQAAKFEPPQTQAPRLSSKVTAIISKAMKKSRDDRYRSADAMLADLEKVQRAAFGGAGQTELKAWLRDLSARDGQLRLSDRVAPPLPEIGSAELISDLELSSPGLVPIGSPPPLPPGSSPPRSPEPLPPAFSAERSPGVAEPQPPRFSGEHSPQSPPAFAELLPPRSSGERSPQPPPAFSEPKPPTFSGERSPQPPPAFSEPKPPAFSSARSPESSPTLEEPQAPRSSAAGLPPLSAPQSGSRAPSASVPSPWGPLATGNSPPPSGPRAGEKSSWPEVLNGEPRSSATASPGSELLPQAGSQPEPAPHQSARASTSRRWPLALMAVLVLAGGGWFALHREPATPLNSQQEPAQPTAQLSAPGAANEPEPAPPPLMARPDPAGEAGPEAAVTATAELDAGDENELLDSDASVGSAEEVALAEPEPGSEAVPSLESAPALALESARADPSAPASALGLAPTPTPGPASPAGSGPTPASGSVSRSEPAPGSGSALAPASSSVLAPASASVLAPGSGSVLAPASGSGLAPAAGSASRSVPAPTPGSVPAPSSGSVVAPALGPLHAPASRAASAPAATPSPARTVGPAPERAPAPAPVDTSSFRSVRIVSVPPGASVRVEKTTWGTAPINLKFRPGVIFAVVLSLKGYDDATQRFLVKPLPGQVVTVRLAKHLR